MFKVLLTVSPSRPSFPLQFDVYPKEPRRLPSLPPTTFPRPFNIHLNCPGVWGVLRHSQLCVLCASAVNPVAVRPSWISTSHRSRVTSHAFSFACRLFASLCSLFRARFLCFQQVAASFAKMPGVGYPNAFSASAFAPSASLRYPLPKGSHRQRNCSSTSSFRINTCKSVSKQTTLTPFRINTCEKTRGGRGVV
jgi:hypothetical protein